MYKTHFTFFLFTFLNFFLVFGQWSLQSNYEHNFIGNKNFAELNHGNKYGISGEYIFSNNLTLSLGVNYTVVDREFTRTYNDNISNKLEVKEIYFNGNYQTLEFMSLGVGYNWRVNEKLTVVPKLRYITSLRLNTETINASKMESIYNESQDPEENEPYLSTTTNYDNKIDPIMREYRENKKQTFFPVLPFFSVDVRYLIHQRLQGALTFGYSLDNGAVRSHYYNLGASVIFKLTQNED